MTIEQTLRELLAEHGKLTAPVADLTPTSDLYRAGLTSHASIALMLAIEDTFGVEFPQEAMRRDTFESIAAISRQLAALGIEDPESVE